MKRYVAHIIIIVLLCILPLFVNHPIGYIPIICYLLVLLVGYIYVHALKNKVIVSFDENLTYDDQDSERIGHKLRDAQRPSSVDVDALVENKSNLPIVRACLDVEILDPHVNKSYKQSPDAWAQLERSSATNECERSFFSLKSHQVLAHKFPINVEHVGVYKALVKNLTIYDPLCFVSAHVPVNRDCEIVCIPKVHELSEREMKDIYIHESDIPRRCVISDGYDYAGVREYAFGDPIKSVHWKLSARNDGLQTRLFEVEVNKRVAILMDFHCSNDLQNCLDANDAIVESALACGNLCLQEGMEACIGYGISLEECTFFAPPKRDELIQFVQKLPVLSPNVPVAFIVNALRASVQDNRGIDSIIVCTSTLSHALIDTIMEISSSNISLTVIFVDSENKDEQKRHTLDKSIGVIKDAGIKCISVKSAQDL